MNERSVDVKPEDLADRLGLSLEQLMSRVITGRLERANESNLVRDGDGDPAFFRFPESRAYSIFGEDLDEVATGQRPTDEATGQRPTDEATGQRPTDEGTEELTFERAYPGDEKTPFHEQFFGNPPSTEAKLEEKLDELVDAYRRGQISKDTCDSRAGFLICEARRLDVIGKESFVEMSMRVRDETLSIMLKREGVDDPPHSTSH